MTKKRTVEDRIIDATLKCLERDGWSDLQMDAIAKRARLPLAELLSRYSRKNDILAAFFRRIDAAVLAGCEAEPVEDGPARERLFDVLMRRFDELATYRGSLQALLPGVQSDPLLALFLLRSTIESMRWMLEAAGLSADGLMGEVRTRGLAVIWVAAFRMWLRDEPDMNKTMAELDRRLHQAESILLRLSANKSDRDQD